MRSVSMSKLMYWTTGFITGCLLILKYTKMCHKAESVTVTTSGILKQIQKPEAVRITMRDVESTISINLTTAEANKQNDSRVNQHLTTEWLSCKEIEQIYFKMKWNSHRQYRKENKDGNRDVFFTTIKNRTGHMIRVVVKHASLHNFSSESELYRYRSAQREIDNLRKLSSRNWTGIPELYGACVKKHDVTYIVREILGKPLCTGNGTDMECALARHMRKFFHQQPNSEYSILLWLSKVTCFFKQFEEHQAFMEDFSGINFYFHPETFDFYVVDADSIIFYKGVRLSSRSSCRQNSDCSRPTGNLWRYSALNHKIYYACQDGDGYCFKNNCWGYDSSLHTCGVAQWLIKPFVNLAPISASMEYMSLIRCMMESSPDMRCSMINCCEKAKSILERYRSLRSMR